MYTEARTDKAREEEAVVERFARVVEDQSVFPSFRSVHDCLRYRLVLILCSCVTEWRKTIALLSVAVVGGPFVLCQISDASVTHLSQGRSTCPGSPDAMSQLSPAALASTGKVKARPRSRTVDSGESVRFVAVPTPEKLEVPKLLAARSGRVETVTSQMQR